MKKGLLAVSFGTSVNETREKTIDAIERELAAACPDCQLYRAWTSRMIIRKLKQRDQMQIDTVKEAFARMLADGITEVMVQPTHVIKGIENEQMMEEIRSFSEHFEKISVGEPLLSSEEDFRKVIEAVMEEQEDLEEQEALVFMGHGTEHHVNPVYAALDYMFKDLGYENVHVGTVEAYPSFASVLRLVKASDVKKVRLAPFMVVAGDHAMNDMAVEKKTPGRVFWKQKDMKSPVFSKDWENTKEYRSFTRNMPDRQNFWNHNHQNGNIQEVRRALCGCQGQMLRKLSRN